MWCYYNNADEVELFINGQSQGVRKKADSHQYHVMWRVVFDPGEVKVVARKDGREVAQQTIKTAGAPDHIRLSYDYRGKTTDFIVAEVVDKDGNLCPWADDEIVFISMERFTAPRRKAFFGKCLVVAKGKGSITAKSATLKPAWIEIE